MIFERRGERPMDVFHTKGAALLIQAILALETEEECRAFLEDLMTGRECSSATISRVNRCCTYGSGGYKVVLDRIEVKGMEG